VVSKPPAFASRPAPERAGPPPVSVLLTTCEGIWLLQALCGVEELPANLVLRPYVAASGVPAGHHGLAVLREAGVLDDGDAVHPRITRWIEALGAPDVVLCGAVDRGDEHLRLAIARRDRLHVAISRSGDDVTVEQLDAVGSVSDLLERILPLCGPAPEPARFEPITVPSAELLEGLGQVVRGDHTPAVAFSGLGLTSEQRRIVLLAADQPLMQLSLVMLQYDSRGAHVSKAAVTVIDTSEGRIVAGPVRGDDGSWWTQMVPGTIDAGQRAVRSLVATMPAPRWHDHIRTA
jgi:hypothetical protein